MQAVIFQSVEKYRLTRGGIADYRVLNLKSMRGHTLQQTQAARVVGKFGEGGDVKSGAERLQTVGHPYKRTWNWLNSGTIPQSWHQQLLDDAVKLGADLHPYDFVAHLHRPVAAAADMSATG